jgi:hypothetical protein
MSCNFLSKKLLIIGNKKLKLDRAPFSFHFTQILKIECSKCYMKLINLKVAIQVYKMHLSLRNCFE